eukprot:TRINITY_DN54716_c0_g1_i1.p1 TRINITY_DN54716_c0_g1~~TRINITY_DN54716_c0_g1_i1.p1  ORF type:complete len:363 (-),score=30.42 TRINITY_DN54716_c0_g1_i1:950-1951(-)
MMDSSCPNTNDQTDCTIMCGHSGPIYGVDIDPADKWIVSCSHDATARLWSSSGHAVMAYCAHTAPVWDIRFAQYTQFMLTGSMDRTARVWDPIHPIPLRVLAGHFADVEAVTWHPNGTAALTCSADTTVRLWDLGDAGKMRRLLTSSIRSAFRCVAASNNGRLCAAGDYSGRVVVWDISTAKELFMFYVAAEPAGDPPIVKPETKKEVKLEKEVEKEKEVKPPPKQAPSFHSTPVTRSATSATAADKQRHLQATTRIVPPIIITSLAFNPDDKLLICSTNDEERAIVMWNVQTGKHVKSYSAAQTSMVSVRPWSSGILLAVGARAGPVTPKPA